MNVLSDFFIVWVKSYTFSSGNFYVLCWRRAQQQQLEIFTSWVKVESTGDQF